MILLLCKHFNTTQTTSLGWAPSFYLRGCKNPKTPPPECSALPGFSSSSQAVLVLLLLLGERAAAQPALPVAVRWFIFWWGAQRQAPGWDAAGWGASRVAVTVGASQRGRGCRGRREAPSLRSPKETLRYLGYAAGPAPPPSGKLDGRGGLRVLPNGN